jgi:cytochrome P450
MSSVRLPGFVNPTGTGDLDPYPNFAWLRSTAPVAQVPGPTGEGTVWFVTSYALARACLADRRLSHEKTNARHGAVEELNHGDMLGWDPPDHSRLRRLISPLLSPGATERLRPMVEQMCTELIDGFAQRGSADLVGEFAWPIPWAVIHDFYGIPESERMDVSRCIDRFLVAGYLEQPHGGGPASDELADYVRHLIAYKRAHRGSDLTSRLIEGLEEGVVRSDAELEGMLYVLLGAGQVSTGPLIASGALRLLENPSQLNDVIEGRCTWRVAVEEALRLDSPVQTSVTRYALTDMKLGEADIAAGDSVVISLASANRDSAWFENAEQFGLAQRRSNLAFGHGIHLCIGAPLARLEGEVALRLLFTRLSNLRLAIPPEDIAWILGPKLRSPREVPVTFTGR